MTWKANALLSLRPNVTKLVCYEDDILEYEEADGLPLPSEEELQAEAERLRLAHENAEYQRLRQIEYPNMGDQLDMMYWDSVNGTDNWKQAIEAVKQKYPKPD
jgi:hypothetical protein